MAWNQIANKKNNLIFKAISYVGPWADLGQQVLSAPDLWNFRITFILLEGVPREANPLGLLQLNLECYRPRTRLEIDAA